MRGTSVLTLGSSEGAEPVAHRLCGAAVHQDVDALERPLVPAGRVRVSPPPSAGGERAVRILGVVHLGRRPDQGRFARGGRLRQTDQVCVALAKCDCAGSERRPTALRMQGDVWPVAQVGQEEVVLRAPGAALVPPRKTSPDCVFCPVSRSKRSVLPYAPIGIACAATGSSSAAATALSRRRTRLPSS